MALAIVIGTAHRIAASILAPVTTISAIIANAFNEAVSDMDSSAPIARGAIPFVLAFVASAAARSMPLRSERRTGCRP